MHKATSPPPDVTNAAPFEKAISISSQRLGPMYFFFLSSTEEESSPSPCLKGDEVQNPEKEQEGRKRLSKAFPQKESLANSGPYILYSLLRQRETVPISGGNYSFSNIEEKEQKALEIILEETVLMIRYIL